MIKGRGWRLRHRRRHRNGTCDVANGTGCPMAEACDTLLSLDQVAPSSQCTIRRLHGHGPTRQRLLDLGFQPGREIRVLRNAPLNDPLEVQVGDTFIALRRAEARHVEICDD